MASGPLLIVVRGCPRRRRSRPSRTRCCRRRKRPSPGPRRRASPSFRRAAPSNLHLVYIFNGRPSADPCSENVPAASGSRVGGFPYSPRSATGSAMLVRGGRPVEAARRRRGPSIRQAHRSGHPRVARPTARAPPMTLAFPLSEQADGRPMARVQPTSVYLHAPHVALKRFAIARSIRSDVRTVPVIGGRSARCPLPRIAMSMPISRAPADVTLDCAR